ncbi:MAG: VCBS repeat-containing protein, partial [Polyangiales bacterium]
FAEDVTGDGRADVGGVGEDGVWVAPANGASFSPLRFWLPWAFAASGGAGGWEVSKHPRFLADVNADGRKDIVGFGNDAVWVSLSTGTGFTPPRAWLWGSFGYNAGGWRVERHPRYLADVNADGRADVVGFGNDAVWVSLSTGAGFTPPRAWVANYGYNAGSWRVAHHPRFLADVNGDRRADVVGFGNAGVYVSIALATRFAEPALWIGNFGYDAGGWRVEKHPRYLADVNGDGRQDVVGFGDAGVWVSRSTGTGFTAASRWIGNFGYDAGGWRVNLHVRLLGDINGDGRADVVGFGDESTWAAVSTGGSFGPLTRIVRNYTLAQAWQVARHPRLLARVDGNATSDIVGFGNAGAYVSRLFP